MILLEVLWFFLPVGKANMAPIWIKKIPFFDTLDTPIDGGKTFRGKRIFGDHKTIRGFVIGYAVAVLTVLFQRFAYQQWQAIQDISYIDYSNVNVFLWAFLLGFGALLGDAIKSFFKRQKDHPPGTTWFPFDQIDYIVGGLIGSLFIVRLEAIQYLVLIIVWFMLHPLFTWIGFRLRLKDSAL